MEEIGSGSNPFDLGGEESVTGGNGLMGGVERREGVPVEADPRNTDF